MDYRPWFIIVLAVAVALSPVQNISMFSIAYGQGLTEFLGDLYHFNTRFELTCFFALPLIAGYSIFAVKNWSFPVFLGTFTFYIYQTYMTGTFPVLFNDMNLMALTLVINLLLVACILLPTVRAAYFDPSVRWWEAKYRYKIEMDAEITSNDKNVMGKISDISESGILITTESPVDASSELDIKFKFHTMGFLMRGKVARQNKDVKIESGNGHGIVFSEIQSENNKRLGKLIQALELLEFPRRPNRRDWRKDFVGWMVRLVTTGRGITPDLPAKYLRQKG